MATNKKFTVRLKNSIDEKENPTYHFKTLQEAKKYVSEQLAIYMSRFYIHERHSYEEETTNTKSEVVDVVNYHATCLNENCRGSHTKEHGKTYVCQTCEDAGGMGDYTWDIQRRRGRFVRLFDQEMKRVGKIKPNGNKQCYIAGCIDERWSNEYTNCLYHLRKSAVNNSFSIDFTSIKNYH